jgi:hypothetical protein
MLENSTIFINLIRLTVVVAKFSVYWDVAKLTDTNEGGCRRGGERDTQMASTSRLK